MNVLHPVKGKAHRNKELEEHLKIAKKGPEKGREVSK